MLTGVAGIGVPSTSRQSSYEEYRRVRLEYLNCCLRVVKLRWPDALDVVGFATESDRGVRGSEDAAYLDARGWSAADQEDAKRLQKNLGILVSPDMLRAHVSEYPPPESQRTKQA
jgi:hypothetical protein